MVFCSFLISNLMIMYGLGRSDLYWRNRNNVYISECKEAIVLPHIPIIIDVGVRLAILIEIV